MLHDAIDSPLPRMYSGKSIEKHTGIKRALLRKWRAAGFISGVVVRSPGCTRGGVLLLYADSLEAFLAERGIQLREPA